MNAKKNATIRTARRSESPVATRKDQPVTADWLTARMRNGRRRVEVLGWKRLAAIYAVAAPGSRR